MDVRVGLWRKLSTEELMLLNCGVQKEIQPVYSKGDQSWVFFVLPKNTQDGCWSWNSSTLATSCEELTHWKRLWCWEGLGAGGEGDNRGWDGWMASLTRWTWVWVNSRSWWWTGRPGVLWFMGSPRVRHDWATELNWAEPLLSRVMGTIITNILTLTIVLIFLWWGSKNGELAFVFINWTIASLQFFWPHLQPQLTFYLSAFNIMGHTFLSPPDQAEWGSFFSTHPESPEQNLFCGRLCWLSFYFETISNL